MSAALQAWTLGTGAVILGNGGGWSGSRRGGKDLLKSAWECPSLITTLVEKPIFPL